MASLLHNQRIWHLADWTVKQNGETRLERGLNLTYLVNSASIRPCLVYMSHLFDIDDDVLSHF